MLKKGESSDLISGYFWLSLPLVYLLYVSVFLSNFRINSNPNHINKIGHLWNKEKYTSDRTSVSRYD